MTQIPLRPGFGGLPVKTTSFLYVTGVGYVVVPIFIHSVVVLQSHYTTSDLSPLFWCDKISSVIHPWYIILLIPV